MALNGDNLRRLVELAVGPLTSDAERRRAAPPPGESGPVRTLTIAMVANGDADRVQVTLAALRLGHADALAAGDVGFLVVDTQPGQPAAWSLKGLEWEVPGLRYVPADDVRGTAAARDRAIKEANADWVLYLDPDVLLAPGAVAGLLAFVTTHPDSDDLLQGPRLHGDMTSVSTHWKPVWRDGRFGVADWDARGADPHAPPFEIPMQSLSLFACRRAVWPRLNPRLRGTSDDEGYVHEKFRSAGRHTLCLPFLRWVDRSARAAGSTGSDWETRVRNYLVAWEDAGLPTAPIAEHFSGHMDPAAVDIALARWESQKSNPFLAFDGVFCINLESRPDRRERVQRRFEAVGISDEIRWIQGVETPANHHIGCALSHRRAIELAWREGMGNVLVFEDDAVFLDGALWVLRRALQELADRRWNLLYLGSYLSPPLPLADGCHHLDMVTGRLTGAHALVYHGRLFDRLLTELPNDVDGMAKWVARYPIDVHLTRTVDDAFRVSPMIVSQEMLISRMPPDLRDQYVLAPSRQAPPLPRNRFAARTVGAQAASPTVTDHPPAGLSATESPHVQSAVGAVVSPSAEATVAQMASRSPRPDVTDSAGQPSVTAVMVTGHDERRRPMAQLTARAFAQQTYMPAELLVVNQGREPLLEEPLDRVREVQDGAGLVVGALRNLAWQYATGDLMTCWDDDDIHDPERIAIQVAQYMGRPVALQTEMSVHLHSGQALGWFRRGGFENSLLWPRACTSRYTPAPSGSDARFLGELRQELGGITTIDNPPLLYVRIFHGCNIWDEDHFFGVPRRALSRAGRGPTRVSMPSSDQSRRLGELLTSYREVAPWRR